jgi:hypothetical protein
MADRRVHEAHLHVDHDEGGAARVQFLEGVGAAATGLDPRDDLGGYGKRMNAGVSSGQAEGRRRLGFPRGSLSVPPAGSNQARAGTTAADA